MDFFIHGAWSPSARGRTTPVKDPATGQVIDTVPLADAADADRAIASAAAAFTGWRRRPMAERARLQHAAATALRGRVEEFARLLTRELGRPLAGSRTEVERTADLLDYFAEEGLRLRGELPMINEATERVLVVKEPVGVVVAIAPFNYPLTLLTFKLGAALITGCTVVAKPATATPLTTLKLAELFHQAGYPPGAFNALTGSGAELGHLLVDHPTPRKVAFTGSSAAGKAIAALAARTAKRVTLEMGGQSPAIVCQDADLPRAVAATVKHAFANSGQFCYRVNRIYAQREIYPAFVEGFARAAAGLKVGNGLEPGCDLGPLVSQEIFATSASQVEDAVARGARLVTGGARLTGGSYDAGFFFPPTVLADTSHAMKIMTEETFGPVVGIMPFDELPEAIERANDSPYGLAGYVFSRDLAVALRTAEALEAGSVWVNDIHRSYNFVPFGGYKESGLGREKSRHGLDEYLELKTIYLATDR
jgi:succinate-semialdehyde dehydrogenase/glutarate-semialdehyde dehydrogenase